jgi:hypothetical protein
MGANLVSDQGRHHPVAHRALNCAEETGPLCFIVSLSAFPPSGYLG